MQVLSQFEGLVLVGIFFSVMLAIIIMLRKRNLNKEEFLVANRTAPWLLTAFSMAATWVWAPSMFTAAEKAYTQGMTGKTETCGCTSKEQGYKSLCRTFTSTR